MRRLLTDSGQIRYAERPLQMNEELLAMLRQRVAARYYDRPEVIEVIAQAILRSRELCI